MTIPANSGGPSSGPGPMSQSGADWAKLGFDGNPLPGDPQVLQQIIDDFTYLRDTASLISLAIPCQT